MKTDYSPYLRVFDDGKVWWRLDDAIKLGAGYLPMRDDNGENHLLAGKQGGSISEIVGRRNQILVQEKTLLGELPDQADRSWIIDRDGLRYVDAVQFLEWLWRQQIPLELDYPNELSRLVSQVIRDKKPLSDGRASDGLGDRSDYIAYPLAIAILRKNLEATPEELAMWLCFEDNGIVAYLNANELDPPPKFSYVPYTASGEFDYVKPLMGCWFIRDDISSFNPQYRYITGKRLIESWNSIIPYPEEFIRAKIRESRLIDGHPIMGLTQGSNPGDPSSPPLEDALFRTDQIEEIELSDFGVAGPEPEEVNEAEGREPASQDAHHDVRASKSKSEILSARWPFNHEFTAKKFERALEDRPAWIGTARVGPPGAKGKGSHRWNPAGLAVCIRSHYRTVSIALLDKVIEKDFPDSIVDWDGKKEYMQS